MVLYLFLFLSNQIKYGDENKMSAVENKNNVAPGLPKWKQHFWKPHKRLPRNMTFIDKGENMIRLPLMDNLKDVKDKRKPLKKSPKSTIQKIIKKKKQKTKKILIMKMTSPVGPMLQENFDAGQEEIRQEWKDDATTMPSNQKKRYHKNKYYSKVARYPMPFQRLGKMRTHSKKEKRDVYKSALDGFSILKDLNQMKFIPANKDDSVFDARYRQYW